LYRQFAFSLSLRFIDSIEDWPIGVNEDAYKSVASRLGIALRTVENRRMQILTKLGTRSLGRHRLLGAARRGRQSTKLEQ